METKPEAPKPVAPKPVDPKPVAKPVPQKTKLPSTKERAAAINLRVKELHKKLSNHDYKTLAEKKSLADEKAELGIELVKL